MDLMPIVIVVVAIIALSIAWRIISGLIRFVVTFGIVAVAVYFVWMFLQ